MDWEVGPNVTSRHETGRVAGASTFVVDAATIVEVRRWEGPSTTAAVGERLERYQRDAQAELGLIFSSNDALTSWAITYKVPRFGGLGGSDHLVRLGRSGRAHLLFEGKRGAGGGTSAGGTRSADVDPGA